MRSFHMKWPFVLIDGLVHGQTWYSLTGLVNDPKFTHDTHFKNEVKNDREDKQ